MKADNYSHKQLKDRDINTKFIVKGNELVSPSTVRHRYYLSKHKTSTISLMQDKVEELQYNLAHGKYINKDKLPHDGKYYDRSKY